MATFVNINGNLCGEVIVIDNADCNNLTFPASEPIGQAFIASLGITGEWLQTSYTASYRGVYAGIGFTWNGTDFVAPVIELP